MTWSYHCDKKRKKYLRHDPFSADYIPSSNGRLGLAVFARKFTTGTFFAHSADHNVEAWDTPAEYFHAPFNKNAGQFGDNKDATEHFGYLHDIMEQGVGVPVDKAEYVVGPWLEFDPATERHVGEHADAANALLKDPNRKEFEVPMPDKV